MCTVSLKVSEERKWYCCRVRIVIQRPLLLTLTACLPAKPLELKVPAAAQKLC